MDTQLKVRENKARRAAARLRLGLAKSRTRDPLAPDFDLWMIVDRDGMVVAGGEHMRPLMTLDDVEAWLRDGPRQFGGESQKKYRRRMLEWLLARV